MAVKINLLTAEYAKYAKISDRNMNESFIFLSCIFFVILCAFARVILLVLLDLGLEGPPKSNIQAENKLCNYLINSSPPNFGVDIARMQPNDIPIAGFFLR